MRQDAEYNHSSANAPVGNISVDHVISRRLFRVATQVEQCPRVATLKGCFAKQAVIPASQKGPLSAVIDFGVRA